MPPMAPPPPPLPVSAAALQAHILLKLEGHAGRAGPSLAQRLGLVPRPAPPLSPQGWLEAHLASRARRDSAGECAICMQELATGPQVLLSCSHTFHAACLAGIERCSGRRCPLCRVTAYERRRIYDAAQLHRHTCATRIQAAWRGAAARRQARALRRLLPPAHPALRRRWRAERVGESAEQLVASVNAGAAELDALFAELDASAAARASVYTALDARCGGTSSSSGGAAAVQQPAAVPSGSSSSAAGTAAGAPQAAAAQAAGPDWATAALERCLSRWAEDEAPECPICLAPLGQTLCSSVGQARSREAGGQGSRRREREPCGGGLVVLSCSHAFHAPCAAAFEAVAVASELPPACPCCRASPYQRLELG